MSIMDKLIEQECSKIVKRKDDILEQAIIKRLGYFNLEELKGRCVVTEDTGGLETFYLDGNPLVEFGKIKIDMKDGKVSLGFKYRELFVR